MASPTSNSSHLDGAKSTGGFRYVKPDSSSSRAGNSGSPNWTDNRGRDAGGQNSGHRSGTRVAHVTTGDRLGFGSNGGLGFSGVHTTTGGAGVFGFGGACGGQKLLSGGRFSANLTDVNGQGGANEALGFGGLSGVESGLGFGGIPGAAIGFRLPYEAGPSIGSGMGLQAGQPMQQFGTSPFGPPVCGFGPLVCGFGPSHFHSWAGHHVPSSFGPSGPPGFTFWAPCGFL